MSTVLPWLVVGFALVAIALGAYAISLRVVRKGAEKLGTDHAENEAHSAEDAARRKAQRASSGPFPLNLAEQLRRLRDLRDRALRRRPRPPSGDE